MKIRSKEKINNSVFRKKYDEAKTAYQRLMECDQISEEQKRKLYHLYLTLNPVKLKRAIGEKLNILKTYRLRKVTN